MICKGYNKFHILSSVYTAWRQYSIGKEARILSEILRKGQKRSLNRGNIPNSISMNDYARNTLYSPDTKRCAVLNKVFMDNIGDLTVNGKYSQEIEDMGIKVVKVKISPNLNVIFVYWIHTKEIDEEKANKLLLQVAAYLRFELSALRVMGIVPQIRFVKQEQFFDREIVEKLINDLRFIREIENETLKENDEETKADNYQLFTVKDFSDIELALSRMAQNVYGLNRNKIIANIIFAKTKKQPNSLQGETKPQITTDRSETLRFDKKKLSKTIFKDSFDLKKQRQKNKQLLCTKESEEEEEEEEEDFYDYEDDQSNNNEDEEERMNLKDDCGDSVVNSKNAE